MHAAALNQWRMEQKWPEPIHFSEADIDRIDRAVKLLGELQHRRPGLLFLGYALNARGSTREAMFTLYAQLVVDSLRHLKLSGCLGEPRSLRLIKKADAGFDTIYLAKLDKHLREMISLEFPD